MSATAVRRRFADQEPDTLNLKQAVCIGVFVGDGFTTAAYGANQVDDATRHAGRLRKQGQGARLVWLNTGAWCADLWVRDLARPLGTHPDRFYGPLPSLESR